MTIRLQNNRPAIEQLKPAATEAELRWFRKKQRTAIARTMLLTGGLGALYFVGTLLRDSQSSSHVLLLAAAGLIALTQVGLKINAARSANLVKDIKARRSEMYEEQRKRIFLAALDEEG